MSFTYICKIIIPYEYFASSPVQFFLLYKNYYYIFFLNFQTNEPNNGEIKPMTLLLHGTADIPAHMKYGPRNYDDGNAHLDSGGPYDYFAPIVPGHHSTEEVLFNDNMEYEKELLRNHHSHTRYSVGIE